MGGSGRHGAVAAPFLSGAPHRHGPGRGPCNDDSPVC